MENIQHTPNRMAFTAKLEHNSSINAQTDENDNILITTFKTSPKTPAVVEKKKSIKKKGPKKSLRPRNRFGSQSSDRSDSSQRRPQQQGSSYSLVEYYGDQSTSSARGIASRPDNVDALQAYSAGNREFGPAEMSVQQPQKVVFVIPEGWASTVEFMRFPMPSERNPWDNSSSSSADDGPSGLGPIRSKGVKSFRNHRDTPYYSGRNQRTYDYQTMPTVVRGKHTNSSYHQMRLNSIGPIRRSNARRTSYTPYGNSSSKRSSLNSVDSACTSASGENYNQADNNFYYPSAKMFKSYKYILCWHCHGRGHIKINCPLRNTTHRQ